MHADQVDITPRSPISCRATCSCATAARPPSSTVCVGDPAVDLMPAWNLLRAGARDVYRQALGVDDAAWARGIGWAIVQAIVALPYYVDTNPMMAATP
jgi:hypothetical protein